MTPTVLCPVSRRPLAPAGDFALAAGGERWPVVAGIPYLRAGRDDLRAKALERIDAGDPDGGLAVLLTDQDPFAPLPPPTERACRELVASASDGAVSLREAMQILQFGPVADYFSIRTSTPTFLSGLGLLAAAGRPAGAVVEVACGIGQFLRELSSRNVPCVGVDLVFAKLWLARQFVAPAAHLACGDAAALPLADGAGTTVFCHDAFYFVTEKDRAASEFVRVAGPGGRVLVGHAHNRLVDQGGVAGTPLSPGGYAGLFPGGALYDDAELTAAAISGEKPRPRPADELENAEAVSLICADGGGEEDDPAWWDEICRPVAGAALGLNPLLRTSDGVLSPAWSHPRFAAEYRAATYLVEPMPPADLLAAAERGERSPEIERLARRRILLPAEGPR